jgi:hypothetical protein
MRIISTEYETLDIDICSRYRLGYSCSKPEYDADCFLRYISILREKSVVINDNGWYALWGDFNFKVENGYIRGFEYYLSELTQLVDISKPKE